MQTQNGHFKLLKHASLIPKESIINNELPLFPHTTLSMMNIFVTKETTRT